MKRVKWLLPLSPLVCGEEQGCDWHWDICIPEVEASITSYIQHVWLIHCWFTMWTVWKLKRDDKWQWSLKLWSPFSSTLLMYAESQNLSNLRRNILKFLMTLVTIWPLDHIWHVVFPSLKHSSLGFWDGAVFVLLLAHCLLFFWLFFWSLFNSLTSKHWSALELSSPNSLPSVILSHGIEYYLHTKTLKCLLHSRPTRWTLNSYVHSIFHSS